jgi:hypothetical protein
MSDVIWAAAIAGAVGVGGNVAQYLGVRRQTGVESAKVEAENQRLRQQVRDAERSNRQGTYHRTLAVLDRFDMSPTGYNPGSEEDYMVALEGFNNMVGIHLFGAQSVRDALGPLSEELNPLGRKHRGAAEAGSDNPVWGRIRKDVDHLPRLRFEGALATTNGSPSRRSYELRSGCARTAGPCDKLTWTSGTCTRISLPGELGAPASLMRSVSGVGTAPGR